MFWTFLSLKKSWRVSSLEREGARDVAVPLLAVSEPNPILILGLDSWCGDLVIWCCVEAVTREREQVKVKVILCC